MRNNPAMLLLVLLLALPAAAQTARFAFDTGVDGFTVIAGKGTVTQDTPALPGFNGGALKLEVAAETMELQVISPEFALKPWMLYRLTCRQHVDLGVQLQIFLQYQTDQAWRTLFPVADPPGFLYATLPEVSKGRLLLTLRVPGKSLGRAALIDNLVLQEREPLLRESSDNLYWDGSFAQDHTGTADFTFWGTPPATAEFRQEHPGEGRWYFHVQGDSTYVVCPTLPVQPRRVYHWRCWVRGKGTIYPGMHKLAPTDWNAMRLDSATRVAWVAPQTEAVVLREDAWQPVDIFAPCEGAQVVWFQTYFAFRGDYVDIEQMEMRAIAVNADFTNTATSQAINFILPVSVRGSMAESAETVSMS